MVTIVDGHNLIPKIRGLSLSQLDDESRLIEILQNYSRLRRKKVEIFFDRAAVGRAGSYMAGTIRVTHVSEKTTADEEIIQRIRNAGKRASELLVISSDHHIQTQARNLGAKVLSSDQFVLELYAALNDSGSSVPDAKNERSLTAEEIQEWITLFSSKPPKKYSDKD